MKYPEIIKLSENKMAINVFEELKKIEYDVTEKIQGEFFGMVYDDKSLIMVNKDGEKVHPCINYERIMENYKPRIEMLYSLWTEQFKESDTVQVILWGKFAGGYYNHSDVPNINDAITLSTSVSYAPFNFFCVHDIAVISNNTPTQRDFLPREPFNKVCKEMGFVFIDTLFTGSYDDCVEFTKKPMVSPTYKYFQEKAKLKELNLDDTTCYGFIMKPTILTFSNKESLEHLILEV
jgi:hypothetical protein